MVIEETVTFGYIFFFFLITSCRHASRSWKVHLQARTVQTLQYQDTEMGGLISCRKASVAPPTPPKLPTPDPITGLTMREKELIKETWAVVVEKNAEGEAGLDFFILLFSTSPYMKNYFEHFKDQSIEELRYNPDLKDHASNVMAALASYVSSVDEPDVWMNKIKTIGQTHFMRRVTVDDFENLKTVFLIFMSTVLGLMDSPEIQTAWNKFLTFHNEVVQKTMDEMVPYGANDVDVGSPGLLDDDVW